MGNFRLGISTVLCIALFPTLYSLASAVTPCSSTSDCQFGSCVGVSSSVFEFGCSTGSTCICDFKLSSCTFPDSCQIGQVCLNITGESFPYCVSCNTSSIDLPEGLVELPTGVCPEPLPSSEPASGPDGKGLFLQACTYDSCESSLRCMSETNAGEEVSICDDDDPYSEQTCTCLERWNTCASSDDCVIGERCVKLSERSQTAYCVPCDNISRRSPTPIDVPGNQSFCLSPTPTSSPPSGPDGTGLYLESCVSDANFDEECAGDLSCKTETNEGSSVDCSNPSAIDCTCVSIFHTCENSDDCLQAERCVKLYPWSETAYCVPCESTTNRIPTPIDVNGTKPFCVQPLPTSSPPSEPSSEPSILEECLPGSDCGSGTCITETNKGELDYCWATSDPERERGCTCIITDWSCTDSD